jgi:hypothetical protein
VARRKTPVSVAPGDAIGYIRLSTGGKGEIMMRRVVLTLALLAIFGVAAASAFDPDTLNKVTFKNSTGTKIEMIFLSPGDSNYWGPDLIGADYVMKDNSTLGFYVDYPDTSFKFDVMAIDDKGNKFEIYNYELTDAKESTISFTKKNLTGDAPNLNLATLNLTNNTGQEVDYVFVSPEDTNAWGADMLDEETTLSDGDSHSLVIPVGKDKIKYFVMAADANNDEYQFSVTIDPNKNMKYDISIDPSDKQ